MLAPNQLTIRINDYLEHLLFIAVQGTNKDITANLINPKT